MKINGNQRAIFTGIIISILICVNSFIVSYFIFIELNLVIVIFGSIFTGGQIIAFLYWTFNKDFRSLKTLYEEKKNYEN